MKKNILILTFLCLRMSLFAQDVNLSKNNVASAALSVHPVSNVEQEELWQQPDFVRAYFVVIEPGGALYSVFGHACLRLVCPSFDLDYIFTYESENAARKVLTFLAGNLKMGMASVKTEEYMREYEAEGRGVKQYEFNLPIEYKRELWRVLDQHVAEGMNLPYDFESRGCAFACSVILNEALNGEKLDYADWSPRFHRTRREICNDFAKHTYPWNMMIIMGLVGTDVDKNIPVEEKLIITTELAEVWQNAKFHGEYLLSRDAEVLLESRQKEQAHIWFTPMLVAILLFVMAVVGLFVRFPYLDWIVLGAVTVIGVVITYLLFFSSLPCTTWNWLIVPFNVLPVIAWKWRRYWSIPYACVILVWIAGMLLSLHQLVDSSMIVLAAAFVVVLLNNRNQNIISLELNKCK